MARKLTPKEIERTKKVNKIVDEKIAEGYVKKELTVSVVKANILAVVVCLPICAVFVVLFLLFAKRTGGYDFMNYTITMVAFFASIPVHELIHGLFWAMPNPDHFKVIEFGFIKEMLTPYCTCLAPLKKSAYIIGSAMPGVILGIIPMIISIFIGSKWLLIYGIIMTISAGGDATIILKMLKYKTKSKDVIYLDHPTELGLMVLEK